MPWTIAIHTDTTVTHQIIDAILWMVLHLDNSVSAVVRCWHSLCDPLGTCTFPWTSYDSFEGFQKLHEDQTKIDFQFTLFGSIVFADERSLSIAIADPEGFPLRHRRSYCLFTIQGWIGWPRRDFQRQRQWQLANSVKNTPDMEYTKKHLYRRSPRIQAIGGIGRRHADRGCCSYRNKVVVVVVLPVW